MKSLTRLWKALADDYSAICNTPIDRDFKTVVDRVKGEGISFLTITLPDFGSDFETSLDQGQIESNLFLGFKKRKGLPRFLSGFLLRIFDGQTLNLKEDPCIFSIRAIRNLTLLFKKVEFPCSDERNARALEKFIDCEVDLRGSLDELSESDISQFAKRAILLYGEVFDALNRKVQNFELSPKHGPGATANRKEGNGKYVQDTWTDRLEEYFPFGEYSLTHWKYFQEYAPDYLTPEQELPVKITLVPKTLKTPRIIAVEPSYMQYMQQSLMAELVSSIENTDPVREWTHFTDQSLNQEAAREASISGSHATLDLSEASDRVLNVLVERMLAPWPDLSGAVQACRSTRARMPDGKIIPLVKFASMGSALTFPIEAIVFTTLVSLGIVGHSRVNPSSASFKDAMEGVHVYGDDMIVPIDSVPSVIRILETFGLKVNRTKSFWTGKFRESCGGDFFDGVSVKPIRLKRKPPETRRNVAEILAWSSMMNSFFNEGLTGAGRVAQEVLERAIGTALTQVPPDSGAVGIHNENVMATHMHPTLHKGMVRAWAPDIRQRENAVEGPWALRKTLTGEWSDPLFEQHLTHSGRSLSSRMKRVWVPVD